MAEYYAQYGTWPTLVVGNLAGSLGLVAVPSGKYVQKIDIVGAGTLIITYANTGGSRPTPTSTPRRLVFSRPFGGSALTGNGDVVWICGLNAGPTAVHQPAVAATPAAASTNLDAEVPAGYLPRLKMPASGNRRKVR